MSHDTNDFTQGLAIENGEIFESTGHFGKSFVIRRKLANHEEVKRRALPKTQFGEGLAIAGARIFQLTWSAGVAWVYNRELEPIHRFSYQGEGWGLAWDGRHLLMSNGSDRVTFRDPDTFQVVRSIRVTDGRQPVTQLNELEFAQGWLFANVWQTDRIALIDAATGDVRGWYDLSALKRAFTKPDWWKPGEHVLNGIAWEAESGHYYVTGKRWPLLFRMELAVPER